MSVCCFVCRSRLLCSERHFYDSRARLLTGIERTLPHRGARHAYTPSTEHWAQVSDKVSTFCQSRQTHVRYFVGYTQESGSCNTSKRLRYLFLGMDVWTYPHCTAADKLRFVLSINNILFVCILWQFLQSTWKSANGNSYNMLNPRVNQSVHCIHEYVLCM